LPRELRTLRLPSRSWLAPALAAAIAPAAHAMSSASYQSGRDIIDNGSGTVVSANYLTRVSIGQPVVGYCASANYRHGRVQVAVVDWPPTVSITSPTPGTEVSGTVTITADATDDIGITGVQFIVDGSPVGAGTNTGGTAWELAWDTRGTADGNHTLTARATDTLAQTTTSAGVTVSVQNAAPPGDVLFVSPGTVYFQAQSGAAGVLTEEIAVRNISMRAEPYYVSVHASSLPNYLSVTPTGFSLPRGSTRTVYVQMDPSVLPSDRSSPLQSVGQIEVSAEGGGAPISVDVQVGLQATDSGSGCVPGPPSGKVLPLGLAALVAWLLSQADRLRRRPSASAV
jgi:hypothetical protein